VNFPARRRHRRDIRDPRGRDRAILRENGNCRQLRVRARKSIKAFPLFPTRRQKEFIGRRGGVARHNKDEWIRGCGANTRARSSVKISSNPVLAKEREYIAAALVHPLRARESFIILFSYHTNAPPARPCTGREGEGKL